MANYTQQNNMQQIQQPVFYPNNNNLISNTPYDNYMGRATQQNFYPNQNHFLRCRPVSSREEAMASQIDLDGSLWVFTDINNGKIYTKQINNDGTASFNTYEYVKEQIPYTNNTQFVTKQEFNKVIQSLMAAIAPSQTEPQPQKSAETPTF